MGGKKKGSGRPKVNDEIRQRELERLGRVAFERQQNDQLVVKEGTITLVPPAKKQGGGRTPEQG